MSSKWFQDLNIKRETLKFLEGNTGDILNGMSIAQGNAPNISRWDYIKRTHFCTAKETITVANIPQDGRKSLPDTHQTRS